MKVLDIASACSRIRAKWKASRVRIDVFEDRYEVFVIRVVKKENQIAAGSSGEDLSTVLERLEREPE